MGKRVFLSLLVIIVLLIFTSYGPLASYNQQHDTEMNESSQRNSVGKHTENLISIDIKNQHLEMVLKKLSRDYKITFLLPSPLQDDEVMVRFSNLNLDKAIKKILAPYNTVFIYDEIESQSHSPGRTDLKEVRIYPSDVKSSGEEPMITIQGSGVKNRLATAGQQKEDPVIRLENRRNGTKGRGLTAASDDVNLSGKGMVSGTARYPGNITSASTAGSLARAVTNRGDGLQEVTEENAGERSDGSAVINDGGRSSNGDNQKELKNGDHDGDGRNNENKDKGKDECGQVTAVCAEAEIKGDSLIVPIEIAGDRGDTIEAWGFDVDLKGFKYVEWIKSGCLAEESSSFMCNQLANGRIRCGSYTGELYIEGIQTLFKLHLKKDPNSKNGRITLMNFVDNLARSRPSECSAE
jgi:hypothetical protein